MKLFCLTICSFFLIAPDLFAQPSNVLPTDQQIEWINKEIGVIITLDINIYAPETFDYAKKETLPPVSAFHPSRLNTDQWVLAAKSAGAKYAVLTAKHGTGFALWHTKSNDYHVGNSPVKLDVVSEFIKSCKKYGVKPGIYYNTNMNTYYGAGYIPQSEEKRMEFNSIVYQQLSELWSNYGELFEIWFDGGVMSDPKTGISDKVKVLIAKHQPNALLFGGPTEWRNVLRWVGNEDGGTPYPHWSRAGNQTATDGVEEIHGTNGNPDGKYWMPGEADFPNRNTSAWNGGWLWREGQDSYLFNADEILDRYYTSVGRNSNMLIGMVIDTAGLFPELDATIFKEFGNKLSQREKSKVGSTKGAGYSLTLKFKSVQEINQVEIQEDIAKGERIRAYQVEALINGDWIKLCEGISVGHKRIQLFDKVKASSVKLTVNSASEKPLIERFSAFMYE